MAKCDAIVIGSGVVGVATAWALASRGLRVTVVESEEAPATGASFANGGQLSYAYADALASPAMVSRLPFLMLGLDPAFRVRLSIDPELLLWGLRFLREGRARRFTSNSLAQLELAFESRVALHRLLAQHPIDFGHTSPGKILLYESERGFASAYKAMASKEPFGARQQALGAVELAKLEPALSERAHSLAGAIFSPAEEVGDAHRFATRLLHLLCRDYGVVTRFGFHVTGLVPGTVEVRLTGASGEQLTASHVIVCAGQGTASIFRPLGIRVPIQPIKGYSITAPIGDAAPKVSVTDISRRLVFCQLSGRMRIAGLAEFGNCDPRVDPRRLEALVQSARFALPRAADYDRIETSWAGLRPTTPFSKPLIATMAPGVIVNSGHGALGWTLAMGSAERTASLLITSAIGGEKSAKQQLEGVA